MSTNGKRLAVAAVIGLGAILLLVWLVGDDAPTLEDRYRAAVEDARVAERHEISRDLVAIVEGGEGLEWKGKGAGRRVLMVTWAKRDTYDDKEGKALKLDREVWVTAVPELRKFLERERPEADRRTLRIEQLLGLPPNGGKTKFVELWAWPGDLFRPSPDPSITDHEAELDFHPSHYVEISPDYVKWFNGRKARSYGEKGYPWTRLGYSYDWGNPVTEVGLSEFVIRRGATVEVDSVTPTEDYGK